MKVKYLYQIKDTLGMFEIEVDLDIHTIAYDEARSILTVEDVKSDANYTFPVLSVTGVDFLQAVDLFPVIKRS